MKGWAKLLAEFYSPQPGCSTGEFKDWALSARVPEFVRLAE